VPLSTYEIGKLRIVAHVREELDRAGISAESIRCKSGGTDFNRGITRLTITVDGTPRHVDLTASEVEDCEVIVAGAMWHKIAGLIDQLR